MGELTKLNRAKFSLEEEFYNRLLDLLEERRKQKHKETVFSRVDNGVTIYPNTLIPSKEDLKKIVETAFWASLQREEGRPLAFSVAYNESVEAVVNNSDSRYFLFEESLPFSVQSITKIAPAAGRQNFGIAVTTEPELRIWGLLNDFSTPFRIRTLDPGQLTIRFLGANVAAVSGTTAILMEDYVSTSTWPIWYRSNNENPYTIDAILSILRTMRALHHGGALIIVPSDGQWRSSVQQDVPYPGDDHFTAIHEAIYELEQAEIKKKLESFEDRREDGDTNSVRVSWWRRRLDESSADLAQLTAVDGATVVTKNLVILGFGVKLKSAHSENPLSIYVTDLLNPKEQNKPSSLNELGGTRHQSAALFISEQRNAIALVVSQDGNVSAFIWREAGEGTEVIETGLYVYRHLELTL